MDSRLISVAIYGGSDSSEMDLYDFIVNGEKSTSYLSYSGDNFKSKSFTANIEGQEYLFKGKFWLMVLFSRFSSISADYTVSLSGKQAIFLAADLHSKEYEEIKNNIITGIKKINYDNLPIYFVVNNADLAKEGAKELQAQYVQLAKQHGMSYLEYSAETGLGIDELLTRSARDYLLRYDNLEKKKGSEKEVKMKDEGSSLGWFSKLLFGPALPADLEVKKPVQKPESEKEVKMQEEASWNRFIKLFSEPEKPASSFIESYLKLRQQVTDAEEKIKNSEECIVKMKEIRSQLDKLAEHPGRELSERDNNNLTSLYDEIKCTMMIRELDLVFIQRNKQPEKSLTPEEVEQKLDVLKQFIQDKIKSLPNKYKQRVDLLEERFNTVYPLQKAPGGPSIRL